MSQLKVDNIGPSVNTRVNILGPSAPTYFGTELMTAFPPTPSGGSQTAVKITAGTGAPNNAEGSDGYIYLQSNGDACSTIYHKRSGVWTPVGNCDSYFGLVTLLCPLSANATDYSSYNASPTTYGVTYNSDVTLFGLPTALMSGGVGFGDNAQYLLGSGAFCIDVHIYPTSLNTSNAVILSHAADAMYNWNSYAFHITANSTNGVNAGFGYSGGQVQLSSGGTNIPALNTWTHIRVRRMASGTIALYMNGVQVNSGILAVPTSIRNPVRNPTPLLIGRVGGDMGASHYSWPGRLANIRITVGEGRSSGDFTPPTMPYPLS